MSSKYRRIVARGRLAAIPAVAALAVAGGVVAIDASSASAKKSAHVAAGTLSAAQLKNIEAIVAKAQQAPAWTAPGPAVSAKVLKGKKIVTFPISDEIDACNTKGQQGSFAAEAKKLGANVVNLTANAGPTDWNSDLAQAISQKAKAVVMFCGPTAAAISTELTAVKNAHIPVVNGNYNQTGGSPAFPFTNLSGETGTDTEGGVTDDFLQALINLKGAPAHVLYLDSEDVAQYQGAKNTLAADIKKYSPASSIVKEEDFHTAQWGAGESSTIASDLQANPSINTVIVTFDGMTDDIMSVVQQVASSHKGIKIYAWGGGLTEVGDVASGADGGILAGDSGPDEKWDAYNALDQVIRLLGGKPAANLPRETVPNIFFTKKNAASFESGGNYSDKAYSNGAFEKDFLKLWGVTK